MQINDAMKSLRLHQIERKLTENNGKVAQTQKSSSDFSKNEDIKYLIGEVRRLNKLLEESDNSEVSQFAEDFLKRSIGSVEWEDLRQRAKSILRKYSSNV